MKIHPRSHVQRLPPQLADPSRLLRNALGLGVDLLFPPACTYCHSELDTSTGGLLCATCLAELTDSKPACARCGARETTSPVAGSCLRCKNERFGFESVVRLASYDGAMRSAVLRMKRDTERALAISLGDLLATARLASLAAFKLDAVVPIPMHWSRRIWRGVNSPETIAERVARQLNIPLASSLLKRRRRTAPQASLTPSRRLTNVRGAFQAARHPDLLGARLLVVDDIMTTGATVNEAAKMLTRAGASFVAIAVLARAEGPS